MDEIEKEVTVKKNKSLKCLISRYLILFVIIFLVVLMAVSAMFIYFSRDLPLASEVLNYKFDTGSEVYDANGKMIHMYAFEQRKLVELNKVPKYLVDMLIVTEDSNFYNHWGIDIFGIIRAVFVNLKTMKSSQGASTITQQLARNMFLSTEKIYSRKIKEAILAVMIETQFTKSEILESYLNKVLFGNGYYGVETAAMNYFLKSSSELSISESALLVGLLKGSGYYNPLRYPDRSLKRRNLVLNLAYENQIITEKQFQQAISDSLVVNSTNISRNRESDYFIEYIRPYIEKKYGTERLFTGGLKIYTTIDYDLQQYADSVLNVKLTELETLREYEAKYEDVPKDAVNIKTEYLQGGVFAIDPNTGFVKVMIGGRNFKHSKFNRVMQAKRQPGSCFKPILYTTAIMEGFTPATVISDEPLFFIKDDELFWEPKNYTREFRGFISMREALQRSINVVAAKMIYDIGPFKVVDLAKKLDLSTPINPFLSLAVGSCEVIPYELISAYTVFANRGELVKPIFISKITDSKGKVLERYAINKKRILDPKVAYVMTDMLKTVVDEGTAVSARYKGLKMPAGGKTGTTDDYRDAWFIGFGKNLVMGSWVGFDNNVSMEDKMTGSSAALPIWIPIMKHYENKLKNQGINIYEDFDMPEGIIRLPVSKRTGLLPADLLEPTKTEIFIEYTEPNEKSDSYRYNIYPKTQFLSSKDHILKSKY
ncbi:MAG: PBP1A family penicillin-binding protein [Candidatus Cloacimonetes bacterium]|nr:PBP1A family penicillin-binding protein [Candidatus Cloacimonadota bacterium]MDD4155261.1 PBP1A family penicillin-binding protein [Candidatus Cloacimonadota bacterium]